MLNIVKQIIKYHIETGKNPTAELLNVEDKTLLEKKGSIFVTLYKNGNIIGSSGNIIEIEQNIIGELIGSTIGALNDVRFKKITIPEVNIVKTRIDIITNRILLKDKKASQIDIIKFGVIAIKKDYTKLAIILPNISNNIDINTVLSNKLGEDFVDDNYIVYEITTDTLTDF